jgi:hypothetical protein
MGIINSSLVHGQSGLRSNQYSAILKEEELSEEILTHHSEIADDRRSGMGQKEIVLKYGFHLNTTLAIARSAVSLALQKLIPDERERIEIARNVIAKSSHDVGMSVCSRQKGIHALDSEEKRTAGLKGTLVQGKVPWKDYIFETQTGLDEFHYCLMLLRHPKFQNLEKRSDGSHKGIANELNRIFHRGEVVRTRNAIHLFINKYLNASKR